ncbi:MAG: radical SAM protein [Candidatus Woesearchaeota archaeon]
MAKVVDIYPVLINDHIRKLSQKSTNISKQFFPDDKECFEGSCDYVTPWKVSGSGYDNVFGLEAISKDKAIIMPSVRCFSYCRFCIRKDRQSKNRRDMTKDDIEKLLHYLKNKNIREAVITGGDPFVVPHILSDIINCLQSLDHIKLIRIGTRTPVVNPDFDFDGFLSSLRKDIPIEFFVQINHPDELNENTKKTLRLFISSGFRVYNQCVLLKNINDSAQDLFNLFDELHTMGIDTIDLYHCAPIQGVGHFRTTVEKSRKIITELIRMKLHPSSVPDFILLLGDKKSYLGKDIEIIEKTKDNLVKIRSIAKGKVSYYPDGF